MKSPNLKIGLAGFGHWGKRIYQTLCTFPNLDIAILDKDQISRDCDAVVIATPSATHAQLVLEYSAIGVPIFVEKPLATSVEDVRKILDFANKKNSIIFVGYIYLYNNFIDIAHKHLCDIEPLRSIEFVGYNSRPRRDSSLLWDWLPHDLSICFRFFKSMPEFKFAEFEYGVDSITKADVTFLQDQCLIISRLSTQMSAQRTIKIKGQNGEINFDDRKKEINVDLNNDQIFFDSRAYDMPLRVELNEFINIVKNPRGEILDKTNLALQSSLDMAILIEKIEKVSKTKI